MLIECPDCKNQISPNAEACPQCGAVTAKRKKNIVSNEVMLVAVSLVTGIGVLWLIILGAGGF